MSEKTANSGKGHSGSVILIVACILLTVAGVGFYIAQPLLFPVDELPVTDPLETMATVEDARSALRRGEPELAGALVMRILQSDPQSADALLIAGEAAVRLGNLDAAISFYERVPKAAGDPFITARWSTGNVLLYAGKLREAETQYREALALQPKNIIANERLAFILGVEGRRWESAPFLFEPIRQGHIFMEPLLLLATVETRSANLDDIIEKSRRVNPDDWIPLTGTARIMTFGGDHAGAEKLIRGVLQHEPNLLEAHSLLGRVLVETENGEGFRQWLSHLPQTADSHPDIWYSKGVWAQNHGDPAGAARCFWEAVRIHPSHSRANYRLGRVLATMGRDAESSPFLERAKTLENLTHYLNPLYEEREHQPNPDQMTKAAEICESLGRIWESWAWYQIALEIDPRRTETRKEIQRLSALTSDEALPLNLPDSNPANQIDLSSLPLPDWDSIDSTAGQAAVAGDQAPRFVDVTADANFRFTYQSGDDPNVPGMMLVQQNGGAIAVLDYDLDGWPDIYVAQSGPWPPVSNQTKYRDQLFRNLGNGTFKNVTEAANLGDNLYSQGAAIGDFNNDGLPDICVSNVGPNRIYRNEGDGTFTDVTSIAGLHGERWSCSCAIADVNGDSLPDLYFVNYLTGKEALTMECFYEGKRRACAPTNFPAEQDRLYLNLGDGRFEDVTEDSGVVAAGGKGLGVVVADLQCDGSLEIYVGNDTTANFYFVNQAKPGESPQFVDRALLAGVAYDCEGLGQASMGITIGDGNDDGLLDIFVGNYYQESNTFYKQESPDFFSDASHEMGLRGPSIHSLTFGTQFLDFELDGRLDLVTACGHVDDFTHQGKPYHMSPQLFSNQGEGHYVFLPGASIGPFFVGKYLSRSVATLDWDRDGKQDYAVLDVYKPSSLLANRTVKTGHFLDIHVRSPRSARDAIGTTIFATVGDRTLLRQLTAGGGFQCSCQPTLHFGLGDATQVDRMLVRWPSGTEQTFDNVPVDREVMLIEGSNLLVDRPRDTR